jgi:hypothetical protein
MGVARQVAAALGEVVGENPILRTGEPRLGKSLRNCVRRIGTEVGIDDDQFEVVPAATAPISASRFGTVRRSIPRNARRLALGRGRGESLSSPRALQASSL